MRTVLILAVIAALAIVLVLFTANVGAAPKLDRNQRPTPGPVPPVVTPRIVRVTLSNGLPSGGWCARHSEDTVGKRLPAPAGHPPVDRFAGCSQLARLAPGEDAMLGGGDTANRLVQVSDHLAIQPMGSDKNLSRAPQGVLGRLESVRTLLCRPRRVGS